MAYRAYVESIRLNEAGADNFYVTIKFEDAESNPVRTIRQEYKFVSGTTRAEFEQMVLSRRNELRALDAAHTVFDNNLGAEIT